MHHDKLYKEFVKVKEKQHTDIYGNIVMKKIRNIIIGWYRKLFNKNSDLATYRLSICRACPYKIRIYKQDLCDLCGCVLDAKVRVEDEKCYDNRW